MDETKNLIASNLTTAFYSGTLPREPYLGKERREIPYKHREIPNTLEEIHRAPTISVDEVFYVYSRFLSLLDEGRSEIDDRKR